MGVFDAIHFIAMRRTRRRHARMIVVNLRYSIYLESVVLLLASLCLPARLPAQQAGARIGVSELLLTPRAPRPGDTVIVEYRRSMVATGVPAELRVRARLRTPRDRAYSVPDSMYRVMAVLRLVKRGEYRGRFAVPPNVVFGTLVVENTTGSWIDGGPSRGWEFLVHDARGRPTLDALAQRANDWMGRSWEEAYHSAQQEAALYPESISAVAGLAFYEGALDAASDTAPAGHARERRIGTLVSKAKQRSALSYDEMGDIFFRAFMAARHADATRADSVELGYWWDRMLAEFPCHEQEAQRVSLELRFAPDPPAAQLERLEALYRKSRSDCLNGPGAMVFLAARDIAAKAGDHAAMRRWRERSLNGRGDSLSVMALFLADQAASRTEGLTLLQRLVTDTLTSVTSVRRLKEPVPVYAQRQAAERRYLAARLAVAFLVAGDTVGARSSLARAKSPHWDPRNYDVLADAYTRVGDHVSAARSRAWQSVAAGSDAARDSLRALTRRVLSDHDWETEIEVAQKAQATSLLTSETKPLPSGSAQVTNSSGEVNQLSSLLGASPGVVVFWSPTCGPAVEALPGIRRLLTVLQADHTPVVFIASIGSAQEIAPFQKDGRITWPVFRDYRGSSASAFENFGTPAFYVVNWPSRIRFEATSDPDQVVARLQALRQRNLIEH